LASQLCEQSTNFVVASGKVCSGGGLLRAICAGWIDQVRDSDRVQRNSFDALIELRELQRGSREMIALVHGLELERIDDRGGVGT
jgi:hypothetical protein